MTSRHAERDTADAILDTAARLFYAHGVRAVGVEWIVRESGIAKTSLYRHYSTKDALVAAFLDREDREFWEQWESACALPAGDPQEELMALLGWIGSRVSRDGYRGCPQINVAAEFSDPAHPARRIRQKHKAQMYERLCALTLRMRLRHPEDIAMQLALLIDGAFTSDGRLSRQSAPRILRSAAEALIEAGQRKKRE